VAVPVVANTSALCRGGPCCFIIQSHASICLCATGSVRSWLVCVEPARRTRARRRAACSAHVTRATRGYAPTAGHSWTRRAFAFTLRSWIGRVLASAASTSVETWRTPPTKRSRTSCGAWRACRHGSASTGHRGRGGHRKGRRFHTQNGALANPILLLLGTAV